MDCMQDFSQQDRKVKRYNLNTIKQIINDESKFRDEPRNARQCDPSAYRRLRQRKRTTMHNRRTPCKKSKTKCINLKSYIKNLDTSKIHIHNGKKLHSLLKQVRSEIHNERSTKVDLKSQVEFLDKRSSTKSILSTSMEYMLLFYFFFISSSHLTFRTFLNRKLSRCSYAQGSFSQSERQQTEANVLFIKIQKLQAAVDRCDHINHRGFH